MRTHSSVALVALLVGASLLAGCPRPPPTPPPTDAGPPPVDAGPRIDAGPLEPVDTDGDGLCDDSEIAFGTDPENRDSDEDGFTDRVERDLGYAPLVPDSPDDVILVFMDEGGNAQFPVSMTLRSDGDSFTGAFNSLPVEDDLDLDAFAFFEVARAINAVPMDNVTEVRPDPQQFVAVFGRTTFTFEIRFDFADNEVRGCARAYPFRYDVKRDDGVTVFVGRYLLVVRPPDIPLEDVTWCVEASDCR